MPIHRFPSALVPLPADEVHRRLTADPRGLLADATATALTTCTPLLRRWGLPADGLPSLAAGPSSADGAGSVWLHWRGDEAATGWPALRGELLVSAASSTSSWLTLTTTRTPIGGLGAVQLDALHRRSAIDVTVRAFLEALVAALREDVPTPPTGTGAAR